MKNNKKIKYTVAELIEALKSFPQDLPVLVSGYETGYENLVPPKVEKLKHYPDKKYWDGEFQEVGDGNKNNFEAVVIERVVRND